MDYSPAIEGWTFLSTIDGCPCCLADTAGVSYCGQVLLSAAATTPCLPAGEAAMAAASWQGQVLTVSSQLPSHLPPVPPALWNHAADGPQLLVQQH